VINIRTALSKLRWDSSLWPGSSQEVCGLTFINLRPVRPVRHGSVLNKTGRLVLRGELDGRKVKIYEAANEHHARFIEALCAQKDLQGCFPATRSVHGRFLVADWVENRANSSANPAALAALLQRIHRTPLADLPTVGFDYWHDLVKPRFVRAAELLGIARLAAEVIGRVSDAWNRSPHYLMHPDLTPANTTLTDDQWQVIDNELLTIGGLPLFDVCNAAYPLRGQAAQDFASAYLAGGAVPIKAEDESVLIDAWLARILGSQFVAGNVALAAQTIRAYESRQNILPVDLPTITWRA
jgi:aminoglycoside phosphotransferase (APT) family kinase protein